MSKETGIGYSEWASYLINGDDSGISTEERKAADEFAEWLGGNIVDVSEETFFGRPDTGGLKGDCAIYTSIDGDDDNEPDDDDDDDDEDDDDDDDRDEDDDEDEED